MISAYHEYMLVWNNLIVLPVNPSWESYIRSIHDDEDSKDIWVCSIL